MSQNPRIEDLRRRVQKDPASIAFAQLAEEYRRAGQCQQSVEVCRAGLVIHPGYLSARVTLGRALIELGQLDDAKGELELVLNSAPENLAAIRGLAEIHHKRGELADALKHYRAAQSLARNDPDLEQTVNDLTRQLTPTKASQPADGLSFEQMKRELTATVPPRVGAASPPAPPEDTSAASTSEAAPAPAASQIATPAATSEAVSPIAAPKVAPAAVASEPAPVAAKSTAAPVLAAPKTAPLTLPSHAAVVEPAAHTEPPRLEAPLPVPRTDAVADSSSDKERERAVRTISALEQWLAAVDVTRTSRRA
jgi:hypothetical protein